MSDEIIKQGLRDEAPAPHSDPRWITEARRYLGLHEIVGPKHNATILQMWKTLHLPFTDDETPWCAGFVGFCLENVGIRSTRAGGARMYAHWGQELKEPVPGCIVVFWRGSRNGINGHVGFVVGLDKHGNLLVLGGNQGDQVCIKAFPRDRVLSYRWPAGEPLPVGAKLKVSNQNVAVSNNEA